MSIMPAITVGIAHPEKTIRAACLRLLKPEEGIQAVGEAKYGLEALTAAVRLKPRILLLDLNLSRGKKMALLSALREKSPRTKVILLTRRASEARIMEALSHGARGYLKERAISTFLPKAVRMVEAGEAWVPRKMVAKILDRLAGLTARQEGG
jgi:DNA-binding NarL/FixJ family response regulator